MANGKTICTVCNYIYDESLGEAKQNIPPSLQFDDLPEEWRCPECGSAKEMFQPCSCVSIHIYEQTCVPSDRGSLPAHESTLATTAVGRLIAEHPEFACVLEQFGIDYCCGGAKTLADACRKKGIPIASVIEAIDAAANLMQPDEKDWTAVSLSELIDHIVSRYHQRLRQDLPRIAELAEKVARVHGQSHPRMVELAAVFRQFRDELEQHMQKEELILFPGIARIAAGGSPKTFGCGGGLEHPIEVMMQEHDSAGEALARMRTLSDGYTPPPDACGSFKLLLHSLAGLELDMHQHVHKENNILFPRALALAEASCSRVASEAQA